jgi:hypothetical protein
MGQGNTDESGILEYNFPIMNCRVSVDVDLDGEAIY